MCNNYVKRILGIMILTGACLLGGCGKKDIGAISVESEPIAAGSVISDGNQSSDMIDAEKGNSTKTENGTGDIQTTGGSEGQGIGEGGNSSEGGNSEEGSTGAENNNGQSGNGGDLCATPKKPTQKNNGTSVAGDFFTVSIKEHTIEENPDDPNATMTVVFECENTAGLMYYKSDEEIVAGGTWQKRISMTREQWKVGQMNFIHFDLSDPEEQTFFTGGFQFEVDDNLDIINLAIFENE